MDVFDVYGIEYKADTSAAMAGIDALGMKLVGLGNIVDSSLASVAKVSKSVDNLAGRNLDTLGASFGRFAGKADDANAALAGVQAGLRGIDSHGSVVGKVASQVDRLATNSKKAESNVAGVGKQLNQLGNAVGNVEGVVGAVRGVQRAGFGAFKNVQSLGGELGKLQAKAGNAGAAGVAQIGTAAGSARGQVQALSQQLTAARKPMAGLSGGARRFGQQIDSWGARLLTFHSIASAVRDIGKALREGTEVASAGARDNLSTRDNLRELANLQGKASPDNATVAGFYKFREATGMGDREANDALRRFEGGLPTAVAKGNITGNSTEGVAGELFRETGRTASRVGLSGGSAALLTAKIAQTADANPITNADEGLNEFGTIVDLLNRGDGDLTPLVDSLVKTAGGQVGDGLQFKSLPELAAALRVTSLNASPRVAGTRIEQAVAALSAFTKKSAGQTLREAGIVEGDDLPTKVDKIAPLIEGATDQQAALARLGFDNQAQRRAIVQLVANRKLLRDETEAARKGSDPKTIREANDKAFADLSMQNRVEEARNDASKFVAFTAQEETEVLRKRAESDLRNQGQIDNPGVNADDAMADNPIARALYQASRVATGQGVSRDGLPIGLGGKTTRQMRIDARAEQLARDAVRRTGADPNRVVESAGFVDGNEVPEDRIPALGRAARQGGVNPLAREDATRTDKLLEQLVRETERTNQLLNAGPKGAPPPLPQRDRNFEAAKAWRGGIVFPF